MRRLFCLPYAGGGASIYRTWNVERPSRIEVCPIQLPGREDRYREPAFTSLIGLSRAITRELLPYLDKPFAIFGHSLGALLAFETARSLRHAQAPAPLALCLAAYPAPHVPSGRAPIHQLPDTAFIEEMRLPILRADFQACDTYTCGVEPPLETPFFLFGGTEDADLGEAELQRWREQTTGDFSLQMLPGTHFFVQSQRARLLEAIGGHLARLI
jgi:surfactin synthase thioesterase subunit